MLIKPYHFEWSIWMGFAGRQGRPPKRYKMGNCSPAPKSVPRGSIWVGFARDPGQPRKSKFLCRLAGWLAGWLAGRQAAWHLRLLYVFQMKLCVFAHIILVPNELPCVCAYYTCSKWFAAHLRLLYVFQMDRSAFALSIRVPNEFRFSVTNITLL